MCEKALINHLFLILVVKINVFKIDRDTMGDFPHIFNVNDLLANFTMMTRVCCAAKRQKAVFPHFKSKQILPFDFADQ